jgi:histidine triad (HIT) family protein
MPGLVPGIHAAPFPERLPIDPICALIRLTSFVGPAWMAGTSPAMTGNDMQHCLFCAIARGDIPSHRVCESDDLVAFLDINPIRPGHTLIVPRAHHDYFDDLPENLAADIVTLGQRLAREMKAIYGAPRVGFAFMGFDVPHAHAHVLPVFERDDITSRRAIAEEKITFRPPPRASDEDLAAGAERLRRALV